MFQRPSILTPYPHIYSRDPAVDRDHADYDHVRWCETGEGKFLPRKTGGPPACVFMLRPLSRKEALFVNDMGGGGEGISAWWAVAVALESAAPMRIGDEDHAISRIRDGSITRVSDYDMECLMLVDKGALVGELSVRISTEVGNRGK